MNALPVIPWLGGKRRLADKLLPLFPQHECYVEVFCGGAALYFLKRPAPVEVLNDINGDLVSLYRVLTHHLEEFVRQFKWAISSRQVFEWQKMTRPETLTDIQRAARFYYMQHHAFGGKVMVSLNDHPDIRRAYDGLTIIDGELLGIKYSVANAHGDPETSREIVILNYDPLNVGVLF
jgi:site-specific DNA-adenine methylase